MYNQIERGLIESGNAVKLEVPVLMNDEGKIVEDESLAFGRAVTIEITPRGRENTFVMDKTSSQTHGKNDSKKGGG